MASWNRDLPDPHAGDDLAYAEAWENRVPDVEYADEDEAGQLGLGVPGEQRAIPSLAPPIVETFDTYQEVSDTMAERAAVREMFKGFGWSVTE